MVVVVVKRNERVDLEVPKVVQPLIEEYCNVFLDKLPPWLPPERDITITYTSFLGLAYLIIQLLDFLVHASTMQNSCV